MRSNIKDNIKTFMVMEKELEKKYPNKIIAMYNGDVISVGDTYMDTIEKAKKKAKVTKLFIHRLGPSKDIAVILNLFCEFNVHLLGKENKLIWDML